MALEHRGVILPPRSQWRQFRFIDANDHWHKVRETITTPERIEYILNKAGAKDAYCTISHWGNPAGLGVRGQRYRYADNLFFGSDYIVDCDHGQTLTQACKASEILKVKYPALEQTLINTGRGHHLWLHDFYRCDLSLTFRENEFTCLGLMNKLTDHLVNEGVKFDDKISRDTRRVARLWGSTHHNGKKCQILWQSSRQNGSDTGGRSDHPQGWNDDKRVTKQGARAERALGALRPFADDVSPCTQGL